MEEMISLQEFAKQTGASYRTAAHYARKAGLTKNGVKTMISKEQATVILEAMKMAHNGGSSGGGGAANLANNLQGVETDRSNEFKLAMLYKEAALIERGMKEDALQRAAVAEKLLEYETQAHAGTKRILAEREVGLETVQRMAETAGLMYSDGDDVRKTYRR